MIHFDRMSRAQTNPQIWTPSSEEDRARVRQALASIVASPQFCNSKRYPALLEYIVEHTLAGEGEHLKERTLGVDVFERPAAYDTNADTVVRYTAGEVRKRLQLYYSERNDETGVRIQLPTGSYVAEFYLESAAETHVADAPEAVQSGEEEAAESVETPGQLPRKRRWVWLAVAAAVLLASVGGWWVMRPRPSSAFDDFWRPVIGDQRQVVLCSGGVVFDPNPFTGVVTADRNTDYPFVSLQIASAIAQTSGTLVRYGATGKLVSAASTPLTELRDHTVVLLGGYNNQWTLRLLQPLAYHFAMPPGPRIVDQSQTGAVWQRDLTKPYGNSDDYALVARYRDPNTDGWVVALAGLGRNGSEAAAEFANSPHYLEQLRQTLGQPFGERNVEVVLKISVVDGKTGAPTMVAARSW